jgi:hypothetical protein
VFGAGAPAAEASAFCSLIARVSHSNTTQARPSPITTFPLQRPARALVPRGSPSSDISHPAPRYERRVEDVLVTNPEQVKLEQKGNHVFTFGVKGEDPPSYRGAEREG